MTKVKITVVKNIDPMTVFGQEMKSPSGDVIQTCTKHAEGQEFIVENLDKPEDFCGWAWHDVYKDLSVLWFGGEFPWTDEGVAFTACTDGMRPVCFKLERLD